MSFETVARLFKYEELDDFLAAIGYGDINSQHIATKVLDYERREQERLAPLDFLAFRTALATVGRDGDRSSREGSARAGRRRVAHQPGASAAAQFRR
jgi:(p)ppGpp synthase/HD superfamily hydrolase